MSRSSVTRPSSLFSRLTSSLALPFNVPNFFFHS
jgi:hypothetical protein